MKFTLEIELGNDAMQTREDIEAVLRKLGQNLAYASAIPDASDFGAVRDDNGNTVGIWTVSE